MKCRGQKWEGERKEGEKGGRIEIEIDKRINLIKSFPTFRA